VRDARDKKIHVSSVVENTDATKEGKHAGSRSNAACAECRNMQNGSSDASAWEHYRGAAWGRVCRQGAQTCIPGGVDRQGLHPDDLELLGEANIGNVLISHGSVTICDVFTATDVPLEEKNGALLRAVPHRVP
jgi:hypothetical protein